MRSTTTWTNKSSAANAFQIGEPISPPPSTPQQGERATGAIVLDRATGPTSRSGLLRPRFGTFQPLTCRLLCRAASCAMVVALPARPEPVPAIAARGEGDLLFEYTRTVRSCRQRRLGQVRRHPSLLWILNRTFVPSHSSKTLISVCLGLCRSIPRGILQRQQRLLLDPNRSNNTKRDNGPSPHVVGF